MPALEKFAALMTNEPLAEIPENLLHPALKMAMEMPCRCPNPVPTCNAKLIGAITDVVMTVVRDGDIPSLPSITADALAQTVSVVSNSMVLSRASSKALDLYNAGEWRNLRLHVLDFMTDRGPSLRGAIDVGAIAAVQLPEEE